MSETVAARNVSRGRTAPEKVEEMLAEFDAAQPEAPEIAHGPIQREPLSYEGRDLDFIRSGGGSCPG